MSVIPIHYVLFKNKKIPLGWREAIDSLDISNGLIHDWIVAHVSYSTRYAYHYVSINDRGTSLEYLITAEIGNHILTAKWMGGEYAAVYCLMLICGIDRLMIDEWLDDIPKAFRLLVNGAHPDNVRDYIDNDIDLNLVRALLQSDKPSQLRSLALV